MLVSSLALFGLRLLGDFDSLVLFFLWRLLRIVVARVIKIAGYASLILFL